MVDQVKWQSLSQLCKDMLDLSFELEDSIRLVSQLVAQSQSESTSTRITNSPPQEVEISSTNLNEELE